jgi:hypothetical protein
MHPTLLKNINLFKQPKNYIFHLTNKIKEQSICSYFFIFSLTINILN